MTSTQRPVDVNRRPPRATRRTRRRDRERSTTHVTNMARTKIITRASESCGSPNARARAEDAAHASHATSSRAVTACALYAPSKALETSEDARIERTNQGTSAAIAMCDRAGITASHVALAASGAVVACGGGSASAADEDAVTRDASERWIVAASGAHASTILSALESACAGKTGKALMEAVSAALRETSAARRAFAVVALDNETGRGLAARNGRSDVVMYGFNKDGALVLTLGGDFSSESGLEELKPGRFVFGHGYVKPMEFGEFWTSARSSRAGSPAKSATGNFTASPRSPLAPKNVQAASPRAAASPNAYVPPAMRAARAAAAEEERERAAIEAESRRKSEAVDRAVAVSLQNQERLASALGGALASALISAVSRASFASEESLAEVSRFHSARSGRQNIEAMSSFYAPSSISEKSEITSRNASADTCAARVSVDSRRESLDARLTLRRTAC